MQPKVSIITVVYNSKKYLADTINSVHRQSYPNIEYIVIDGGSTDGTLDVIRQHEDKITYWISERDKGIYDAMNKGILAAKGEIIGIINSDDFYDNDAVKQAVEVFTQQPDIDIVHGNMVILYANRQVIKRSRVDNIKFAMDVNHPTCFVRRSVYQRRMFCIKYRIAADYDFLLWCKLSGVRFYYLDKTLVYYRPIGLTGSPSMGNADAFYIWKEHVGLFHAVLNFSKDFSLKLIKVPIKKGLAYIKGWKPR